jgi:hypothetical protein
MRNLYKLIFVLVFAIALQIKAVSAQEQGPWPAPARISSSAGEASEASMVADQYGNLHVFWVEILGDERSIIQYARYNGVTWTSPIDIHISRPFVPIGNVSPAIYQDELYVMWTEGQNGPVFYMYAPVHDALSTQYWQPRQRITIPATHVELQVDSQGTFHVLYSQGLETGPGIYYIRSRDRGETWTEPVWLDPDIPRNFIPSWYRFVLDEDGGLHAVWCYLAADGSSGDWVRYDHSLDGGDTWSSPFTIDKVGNEPDKQLDAAYPVIAVDGRNVHVIWAGGKLHYRNHRYSEDAGQTWSRPMRVFGDLNGQAGDGMVADGAGRIHYFSQIRFPQGVYHAVWDGDHWTTPSLVYLITYGSGDSIGDHIHAHRSFPAVRAGNQLILTLTDPPPEPGRRLFYTQITLDDIPSAPLAPTPTPTAMPTPQADATPVPVGTSSAQIVNLDLSLPTDISKPGTTLWIGLLPFLLLLFGIILLRVLFKLRS